MAARALLTMAGIALAFVPGLFRADGAMAEDRHGLSIFGDLKYAPDFKHFEYVNPDAPKTGRVSQIGSAGRITFDSFNDFILKGDRAQGLELLYDLLMVRAFDEPDAVYGLIALSADVAADEMSVTFKLRPGAKFADGSQITAGDCVFTLETLKAKGHPSYQISLRDVVKAEALDAATVRYTFQGTLVRSLPITVALLPVLPKAYYATRDFEKTSLDKPLGSGPYEIKEFKQGTYVTFALRPGYWAKDLNVNRGQHNFTEVRYDYFRDRTLELEGLLAATFDFREEFTSKDWATGYDKPSVKDGRLIRQTIPDERPSGAQGFFLNARREVFKDARVRKALGLAFDFEWSNRNLFFGLYTRTNSFFENSEMKATGLPSPEELALLGPFKDKLPKEVFDAPYAAPVTDGSGNLRENLRAAGKLLNEAGWTMTPADGLLRNAGGKTLAFEFLIYESGFERIIGPYIKNLRSIGIDATQRRVDPAQYESRIKSFDFDVTVQRYALNLTPGIEVKNYWGSEAAKTDGSFNLAGIADPVVDALAEKIILSKSRTEMTVATRALDRVLRAGHYWVPHWYKAAHNLAFWNKFSWPAVKPKYERGALQTWWYDEAKAATLKPN